MKRRFPAVTIALAAFCAFAQFGFAQDADSWKPAVILTPAQSAQAGAVPASAATPVATPGIWQPAVFAAHGGGTRVKFASFGEDEPAESAQPADMGPMAYSSGGCDGCGGAGCGSCGGCGGGRHPICDRVPVYGLWGGVDYMQAWARGRSIPALVTTDDPGAAVPGALPGATTLFGGERIGDDTQSAGRVTLGVWLDPCQTMGAGVRLFGMEGNSAGFSTQSDGTGDPLLAIPFFDVQAGAEGAFIFASPNTLTGSVDIETSQDVLMGELILRSMLLRGSGYRLDLLGGYHYSQVSDGLDLQVNSTVIDPAGIFPVGTTFDIRDQFDSENDFHAGVVGLLGEVREGRFRLQGLAKIAVGNIDQSVTISGQTVTNVPPPPAGGTQSIDNNGIFAQTSNIGSFRRDETTFVPEAGATLGYRLSDGIEFTVGYTFIYWDNVLLAGESIDRGVDLTQAGGGPVGTRPAFNFNETDFWVQGINLGMSWNY